MSTTKTASNTEPPKEATPGLLRRVEAAALEKLASMLGMEAKPERERVAVRTPEREAMLRKIEEDAVIRYSGDLEVLESALGMLRMGDHFGWRVLYLLHSKKTVRNYEEILGIRIREVFEETGPSSYRSVGLNLADRFPNFWKVVAGEIKIPRRRDTVE